MSVISMPETDETGIVHQFETKLRPGAAPLLTNEGTPFRATIEVFVGRMINSDPKIKIAGFEIVNSYVYQKGDIYRKMGIGPAGVSGEMKHVADGIRVHAVSPDSTIFSGKFPQSHRLLLFS